MGFGFGICRENNPPEAEQGFKAVSGGQTCLPAGRNSFPPTPFLFARIDPPRP